MSGYIQRKKLKTGKFSYYPTVKIDGRARSFGGYKTRRDAEARLRDVERRLADGTLDREVLTFGAFYERWFASKHNLKPASRVSYECAFRLHVLPFFADRYQGDITPLEVQAWIDDLAASGMKPATVSRCFRYFRACMKQAEAWNLIDRSPTMKINLPRNDNGELDFLEPTDVPRLLDAARQPERSLFAVLAMSGLRLGEALALRWRDIDYEMRAIKVTRSWSYFGGFHEPKTPTSRRAVPLLDALADNLRDYYHSKGHPELDDLLFTFDGEKPLDPANVRKRFFEALNVAGLKRVTPHSLRHSYASMMLSYGASVKALQNALGHASATMTLNTYSHLVASDIDNAVLARANQIMTGAEGKLVQFPRREN